MLPFPVKKENTALSPGLWACTFLDSQTQEAIFNNNCQHPDIRCDQSPAQQN